MIRAVVMLILLALVLWLFSQAVKGNQGDRR